MPKISADLHCWCNPVISPVGIEAGRAARACWKLTYECCTYLEIVNMAWLMVDCSLKMKLPRMELKGHRAQIDK